MGYPAERKEAILKEMLPPNNRSIKEGAFPFFRVIEKLT
jgi:hypothetical protein